MMHMTAATAVWIFAGMFILGLFVALPFSLVLQTRAGIPLPSVTPWLMWPLLVIMLVAIGVFVIALVGF